MFNDECYIIQEVYEQAFDAENSYFTLKKLFDLKIAINFEFKKMLQDGSENSLKDCGENASQGYIDYMLIHFFKKSY